MSEVHIIPLSPTHIAEVVELQTLCFPPPFDIELLWKPEHLVEHLDRFALGQHVAVIGSQVVGSATAMIISESNWSAHSDWEATTGGHGLRLHDPEGTTLFGVDISVHPEFRSQGIGRKLYQARFDLVAKLGLIRFGTACRMPDFASARQEFPSLTPRQYADWVDSESRNDRTLTPLLRMGLRLTGVVENHMDDDESGHAAAILEYRP